MGFRLYRAVHPPELPRRNRQRLPKRMPKIRRFGQGNLRLHVKFYQERLHRTRADENRLRGSEEAGNRPDAQGCTVPFEVTCNKDKQIQSNAKGPVHIQDGSF